MSDDDGPASPTPKVSFASDNYSGVHAEVLAALAAANVGHETSYGGDTQTARLQEVLAGHFGPNATAWPVFNGTGANVVALQAMLPRWGAAICAAGAHINVDEGGAPEKVGGVKLLPVATPDGKLTPELIDSEAWGWGFEHRAQPLVVSLTQTTEVGTCYTPQEIAAITSHAHARGMRVHLDGARLANAAAHLGLGLGEFASEAGVDVISLGATKNGALGAEAVVVVNPDAIVGGTPALPYLRKLSMQLASKMRFVSAQLVAMYDGDLWLRNAVHANEMAARLRTRLLQAQAAGDAPGLEFTQETQSNAVFAILPRAAAEQVRRRWPFYDWDAARGEVRWMCAFDTPPQAVDAFADAVVEALAVPGA